MSSPATPAASRRNLELKVRLDADGHAAVRARMLALGGPIARLRQVDRYFAAPSGRLKLRVIAYDTEPSRAELIAYRRPDEAGSRWSDFRVTPVDPAGADDLAATLGIALPPLVEVRKLRELVIWHATRIHLDTVDGLGMYAELETMLADRSPAEVETEHREAITRLGLDGWPVAAGSYSDLLLNQAV